MRPPTPADSGGSGLDSPGVSARVHSASARWTSVRRATAPAGAMPSDALPYAGRSRVRPDPAQPAARPAQAPRGGIVPVAPPGLLGAPVAEALAFAPDVAEHLADAGISNGGCFVRPLPIDTTCAAAARRFFREAVSSLALPSGLVHDGVTMASELAANTLHAQRNDGPTGIRQRSAAGIPEIWLYLRGTGRTRELVCKVFDTERGWAPGARPGMSDAPLDSVSGRGLQVVAGLSAGQWGCHLSRSRLGNWKVPGKAVWFSLRIPPAALADHVGRPRYSPDWLIDELEDMVAARGLNSIVRADLDGISVLSVSRHLTVWRHGEEVSWRSPSGRYDRMDLTDLVDAAEQIVCAHEEMAA
jgi:anti-sigma regulatory factor (Ser/Thr protein kinase)